MLDDNSELTQSFIGCSFTSCEEQQWDYEEWMLSRGMEFKIKSVVYDKGIKTK